MCDSIKIAFILVPYGSFNDRHFNRNTEMNEDEIRIEHSTVQWAAMDECDVCIDTVRENDLSFPFQIEIHLHHIHFTSLGSIRMCRLNIFKYSSHTPQLCIISSDHLLHVKSAWYVYFPLSLLHSLTLCVWAAFMRIKHFCFVYSIWVSLYSHFCFCFFPTRHFVSEKEHQLQIMEKKN